MSELEEKEKFTELITTFCLEDKDAIRLCEDYLTIAHIWDDIYDQDKERSIEEINDSYCRALGSIPMSPLYQANVKEYAVLSLLTALTWQIANRLESGNEDDLIGSFILRNSLMLIIYFTVLLSGIRANDNTWGVDLGERFFREMFQGFSGKYQHFLNEMQEKKT